MLASKKKKKKKKETLAEILMKDFSELPSAKKVDLDEYAVINVSPSVVPNPYLPSFRVFSYNITGAPATRQDEVVAEKIKESKRKHGHRHPNKDKNIDCSKKEYRDTWACRPEKPYHASEDSPSRRNQLWTPLGYAQVSACCSVILGEARSQGTRELKKFVELLCPPVILTATPASD